MNERRDHDHRRDVHRHRDKHRYQARGPRLDPGEERLRFDDERGLALPATCRSRERPPHAVAGPLSRGPRRRERGTATSRSLPRPEASSGAARASSGASVPSLSATGGFSSSGTQATIGAGATTNTAVVTGGAVCAPNVSHPHPGDDERPPEAAEGPEAGRPRTRTRPRSWSRARPQPPLTPSRSPRSIPEKGAPGAPPSRLRRGRVDTWTAFRSPVIRASAGGPRLRPWPPSSSRRHEHVHRVQNRHRAAPPSGGPVEIQPLVWPPEERRSGCPPTPSRGAAPPAGQGNAPPGRARAGQCRGRRERASGTDPGSGGPRTDQCERADAADHGDPQERGASASPARDGGRAQRGRRGRSSRPRSSCAPLLDRREHQSSRRPRRPPRAGAPRRPPCTTHAASTTAVTTSTTLKPPVRRSGTQSPSPVPRRLAPEHASVVGRGYSRAPGVRNNASVADAEHAYGEPPRPPSAFEDEVAREQCQSPEHRHKCRGSPRTARGKRHREPDAPARRPRLGLEQCEQHRERAPERGNSEIPVTATAGSAPTSATPQIASVVRARAPRDGRLQASDSPESERPLPPPARAAGARAPSPSAW